MRVELRGSGYTASTDARRIFFDTNPRLVKHFYRTPVKSPASSVLRIGAWRVDASLDEISSDGRTVKLEPRTMRLLICLADHAGEVVSVEQLLDEVWKDVVVTPDSVYQAVAALRRVLGDDTKEPAYIVNVLRRGYRLIAPVSPWSGPHLIDSGGVRDIQSDPTPAPLAATSMQPMVHPIGRRRALILLVTSALVAGGFWLLYQRMSGSARSAAAPAVELGATRDRSVAVLPFLDLSDTKDQQYFADGLTEELLERLAKGRRLHVAARSSSFYFKGKQATIAEIAKTLGVGYLLEGTVRKAGDTLRITAHLVRADDGYDVWSETYNRPLADVLRVQDEIASAVVQEFQLSILAPEHSFTSNADAHNEYFHALAYVHNASASDYDAAESHLHTALTLDPQFAGAWALLAMSTIWKFDGRAPAPTPEACTSARIAAVRALELDPQMPGTHRAKGIVLHSCDRDLESSQAEFDRALALQPDDSLVLMSQAWLAVDMGHFERALDFARRATAVDPLNPWTFAVLGGVALDAGHSAEAEAAARTAVTIDPSLSFLHTVLAIALLTNHKSVEAVTESEREIDPQYRLMLLPIALEAAGRKQDAERAVQELKQRYGEQNSDWVALYYACGHDADSAVQWLQSYATRHKELMPYRPYLQACLDNLKSDVRYQALIRQLPFAVRGE
jgi:TolB-like protein/DNA-binding winged helix-turn-helix (wHTH) protein